MNMTTTWNNPPALSSVHPLNHHHLAADGTAGNNVGSITDHHQQQQQQASSSSSCLRWNPTAEQLLALEELYRWGVRTPTATQIYQVAARLRTFGNIQPKNVFYWFQNHKARERQKRRRLALDHTNSLQHHQYSINNNITSKTLENHHHHHHHHHSVLRREGYKIEQARSRVRVVNCSKNSEIQRNEKWEFSSSAIFNTSPTTVSICKTKSQDGNEKVGDEKTAEGDDQTLELFPVKDITARKGDTKRFPSSCSTPNYQYIEFLPVKK